ncbi:50S ribosomal protein L17 [Candidatus Desantisbacteria bacterium CG1_02_38_46]|uniref:50S ribosomal protein L17 n=3 Tax=unclassified Candidatus Desantisiibacteriota TaxID=3106372 RepID=A0A2H9PDS7_9BACT|nr:MAG: 50S ribosomal protein L17 [Candidatus Desantisbacteria bacterium CG1_02_38_46]PIU51341.1 MAG: 50S ribosomal protein L17 [Candidatus Desantisbacteria bacterium CG07_land_8_20_14_0_80_39_15]PIZ16965.1 MAG: 50S ribosomal protein L17 [Candidatus Desantisbacteria bacterium CG_4_10_14_0_8_um_filter_39_17]
MRHRAGYRKLGRTSSHRKAMFRNLVISLFSKGKVTTTLPIAKDGRKVVDRIITLGKHKNYARLSQVVRDRVTFIKVQQYVERYAGRAGGYTRIIKIGNRKGDGAVQAILEFVE